MPYCNLNYILDHIKPDALTVLWHDDESLASQAIHTAYRYLNEVLGGFPQVRKIPVGTLADGDYPEALKRLNGLLAVYNSAVTIIGEEYEGELPEYIERIGEEIKSILQGIAEDRIDLGFLRKSGDVGIDPPTPYGTVFYNNWDSGIYTGDRPRLYVVEAESNTTFRWSYDGGLTWEETGKQIGTAWSYLAHGVAVRFCPDYDTSMGTRWEFECAPSSPFVQDRQQVRVVEFLRG